MAYTIFKVPVGYRLYDREKNRIISLQKSEYEALENILRDRETSQDQKILKAIQKREYCCESSLKKIENPATDTVISTLATKVNNMVLQVTQNCNLRCSYCAFSGAYYDRLHNPKHITVETALKAVDFLYSHSSDSETVTIGFYGGEPLLEFELIKKVVEYIETEHPERNTRFNITSNLTLFTDDVIDYMAEKDIQLMISIDGPQAVQDKYRLFANGKGSYNSVMEATKKIKDRSQEYFSRCSTNTVVSPDEDYERIRDFLDNNELFRELSSTMTTVSEDGIKEEISYNDDFYRMSRREKFKLFLYMLGEIDKSKVSSVYVQSEIAIIRLFQILKTGGTETIKKAHPGGPCLPGGKKVFVNVMGDLYPCEKAPEDKAFQIGDLDRGFDVKNINSLINVGQYTEEECLNCWAFLHCSSCSVSMIEKSVPTREGRLRKCASVRAGTLDSMADVEMLKYYGYDFEGAE